MLYVYRWIAGFGLMFVSTACGNGEGGEKCGASGEICVGGSLCIEEVCRQLCNADPDCPSGFACESGACWPAHCLINGAEIEADTPHPENPCKACKPRVDNLGYSNLSDDSGCEDGLFCTANDSCQGGVCVQGASPCGGTTPICSETQRVCVCLAATEFSLSSCDDGLFCTGQEVCAATGECAGGTPPACDSSTPACSDALDMCVECLTDHDCSDPSPSCVDNTCRACPECLCVYGEHDGGDGVCVANGTCSLGYTRAYVDGDGDGVGAGPLAEACVEETLPEGWSNASTDCDDRDANVFRLVTVWPDTDNDGYTAAATDLCVGTDLPAHVRVAPYTPPITAMGGAGTISNDLGTSDVLWQSFMSAKTWDGTPAFCDLGQNQDGSPCSFLILTDFDLAVADGAEVTGAAVHIVRKNKAEWGSAAVVDNTVMLVVAGNRDGENRADTGTEWPESGFGVATYGGPEDSWGLTLTPAVVNDPGFGVALSARCDSGTCGPPEVDYVWLEVFVAGRVDCNDGNDGLWAARTGTADADGDRYGAGSLEDFCIGDSWPEPGYVSRSLGADCYDLSAAAHPGQERSFAVERGDGSFDYNCDGIEEFAGNSEHEACSCFLDISCLAGALRDIDGELGATGPHCGEMSLRDACSRPASCAPANCQILELHVEESNRCR